MLESNAVCLNHPTCAILHLRQASRIGEKEALPVPLSEASIMNYLNSYHPLVESLRGKSAIEEFEIPPYVDYSCRREPDFESEYPSITALCRKSKFAPRLSQSDVVVYITVKSRYPGHSVRHRRLTAIFKIIERFESHQLASEWYQDRGLNLPRNCIVKGNPPLDLNRTSNPHNYDRVEKWDAVYRQRSRENGVFLICKPLFLELCDPPVLTDDKLREIFDRIPGTQNPPR